MTVPMRISLLVVVAVATGWLFDRLGVPVAWLLGSLVTGVAFSVVSKRSYSVNPYVFVLGQALLGLTAGAGFPLASLKAVGVHALPLLVSILITGGLSMLNGYLLWRWTGLDRATALLGTLPGAASSMVAMSSEIGADAMVVAILQYLRVLMIIFLAPVGIQLIAVGGVPGAAAAPAAAPALPEAPLWLGLLVLAGCGLAGVTLGRLLRLPSPNFLGPFLALMVASLLIPYHLGMPPVLFSAGMVILGISIGARFDASAAGKLGKLAVIESAMILAVIAICLGVGYVFHLLTGVDLTTAVIGAVPGAMEAMVATAVELGGDSGLVLAMHMIRWFIILVAGPPVAALLIKRRTAE